MRIYKAHSVSKQAESEAMIPYTKFEHFGIIHF